MARTTAITATTPMPIESTNGIGERGSGRPSTIARWLALQWVKLVDGHQRTEPDHREPEDLASPGDVELGKELGGGDTRRDER